MQITLLKKITIILVLLLGVVYSLPNLFKYDNINSAIANYLPAKTINLGLDLQGGSHLVLEVDLDTYLKDKYNDMSTEVRKSLAKASLRYTSMSSSKDGVKFTAIKDSQYEEIRSSLNKSFSNIVIDRTDSNFTINYTETELANLQNYAIGQILEILRNRVDQFGVAEPLIQRQGDSRIIIELPGVKDSKTAKDLIGTTAKLNFHLVDQVIANNDRRIIRPPAGKIVSYEVLSKDESGNENRVYYLLDKKPVLSGENLADARSGFDQKGQSDVSISFDSKGARQFAKVTTEYTGHRLAIVLDGVTYSAPNLNEPILGGRASITGNFSTAEAENLAIILRAGALPAPVKIVEERTVGPSLGADSIQASKMAIMLGFVFVMVCMVAVYGAMGMIANIALLVNIVLIVALMSIIGSTLTLPGIAGIVLTMGMAVDANVLIFERVKEELRAGAKRMKALDVGYNSALSTIFDANITTLIAAVVLFAIGSGTIKGFALTLSIGIVSSVFTAVMLSRWLLEITSKYTIKEVKGAK
jgi:preprotein translocase subunit SecD